jgi:hypothetical protein
MSGYILSNWIAKMDNYYPLFCLMTGRIGIDRFDYLSIINLFQLVTLLIDLLAQQMQYINLKRNKLKGEDDYEKISNDIYHDSLSDQLNNFCFCIWFRLARSWTI